jgi:hypothetical protein
VERFIPASQFQISERRLLGLLDESVQQNHPALPIDVKENPSDPIPA